jgi:murein DD-endopeptidase MepM/ murein hydrolase activator NlpD
MCGPNRQTQRGGTLMDVLKIAARTLTVVVSLPIVFITLNSQGMAQPASPTRTPRVRVVDLNQGETRTVALCDGSKAQLKLVELDEIRDPVRMAVRQSRVTVEVNGRRVTLVSATYHRPTTVAGVQIDCPITRGYYDNSNSDRWGLVKDARLRLWPVDSPLIEPGTFCYPVRQRWFASGTQMANVPTFIDGGESPARRSVYYHSGLDFGGAEGLVQVVAATDGIVVSAGENALPGYDDTPVATRGDVVYVIDDRGWFYRYSHLFAIDPTIQPGHIIKMGEKIGLLGKEGASGGWSHLHFEIKSRQPSGKWGTQASYAFAWDAYVQQHKPNLIAVARPHHLTWTGQAVTLDASRSWSRTGKISNHEWAFLDGTSAAGPTVDRRYDQPGEYSEILKITDEQGNVDYDFAVVLVIDPNHPEDLPPAIHPAYFPTHKLRANDPITFKVRSFQPTVGGETWDFGDGSPTVSVQSDGNADRHAKNGYATRVHAFKKPGDYIVHVHCTNEQSQTAHGHLLVRIGSK